MSALLVSCGLAELGLDPDTVHLELAAPVDLQPPVHEQLLLVQPRPREQARHLVWGGGGGAVKSPDFGGRLPNVGWNMNSFMAISQL